MSNGVEANFVITRDTRAADPGDARYMLRTENRQITGLEQYVGNNPPPTARVTYDFPALEIPDDAAVVMIGNTQELVDACAKAEGQGIARIETLREVPLKLHYVRMEISGFPTFQNDTLIIIGSQNYWAKFGGRPPDSWKELGGQDQDYVDLYDLRARIQWIKDHDAKPSVDKEGRPLR
jgi:hypothetical protein